MTKSEEKKVSKIILGRPKYLRNIWKFSDIIFYISFVFWSAGVGRSGIYVVIDAIWNLIEKDKKVKIFFCHIIEVLILNISEDKANTSAQCTKLSQMIRK